MNLFGAASRCRGFLRRETFLLAGDLIPFRLGVIRNFLTTSEDDDDREMKEFTDYLDSLKNYEKSGVPNGAGTDSDDGFDLGRMRRLMHSLGNPQSKFKAVHIAGTKGKGSTAAFLSSILRAEGYSVGCYTSPHIRTIRERISMGKLGEPVSSKVLNTLFQKIKKILRQTVDLESGCVTHFEVLTAVAFTLFAEENVDMAVIEAGLGGARDATNVISSSELAASIITTISEEHLAALGGSLESIAVAKSGIIKTARPVVLGGPYLQHIEHILRDKASSMCSPVVSASDPGNRSIIKGISYFSGKPCQTCDIVLDMEKDLPLSLELFDVHLHMLGPHQLQNAATAACAALCLRDEGWQISDTSIRDGLENTYLVGRSQILSSAEVEALGLPGVTVILEGAHTRESAKALADTIQMTFPEARLVLVVAMASDKDHAAFARELLSVRRLEAIFLTEACIAGSRSRTTSMMSLKDSWIQASKDVGTDILDCGVAEHYDLLKSQSAISARELEGKPLLFTDSSSTASIKAGNQILKATLKEDQSGIIVVTGSLHVVSSVLSSL